MENKVKIYDPLGDGISSIQLIQSCGNDKMIVNTARISYANDNYENKFFDEKDRKLLKYLLKNSHLTPFEHNLVTFRIKAPLYVIQEILRHRIGVSINQESHRYVEPGKQHTVIEDSLGNKIPIEIMRKYYVPLEFRIQDEKNKQSSFGKLTEEKNILARERYIKSCDSSFDSYEELISMGICREQARGVLPHSTYSSLYKTVNIRSGLHFLGLRNKENAQWEIRRYAEIEKLILSELFPETFNVLEEIEKEREL
jgi:thymidylate synthase (FAD)